LIQAVRAVYRYKIIVFQWRSTPSH
jgi:hypothetical protein